MQETKILYEARTHWRKYVIPGIIGCAGVVWLLLEFIFFFCFDFSVMLAIVAALWGVLLLAKWSCVKMTVTEKKVFIRSGLFGKNDDELDISKIQSILLRQSVLDRLFGSGTLLLCTSAVTFRAGHIRQVKEAKRIVSEQVDKVQEAKD